MAKKFAEIAFSEASKMLQEKYGSRKGYERIEKEQHLHVWILNKFKEETLIIYLVKYYVRLHHK